jgi:cobalt-zinc-cadmium efflux system protein
MQTKTKNSQQTIKNIQTAFFLNITFTIIEIIGGLLTNSMAILSDALHDLGDSFSFGMSWWLEKYSDKKRTERFSYGYKRFSLLGAFINALVLIIGSIFILWQTIPRLIHPVPINTKGMIGLSLLGIAVNGYSAYRTRRGESMNEKMVSLNLLEDVLGWSVIFIVSIVMSFTELMILDPILSIGVMVFIGLGIMKNMKQIGLLFLQAVPGNISPKHLKKELLKLTQIKDVHDIHIWSLDGERHILSAHIVVDKDIPKEELRDLRKRVKNRLVKLGIGHSTLEVEFAGEKCLDDKTMIY